MKNCALKLVNEIILHVHLYMSYLLTTIIRHVVHFHFLYQTNACGRKQVLKLINVAKYFQPDNSNSWTHDNCCAAGYDNDFSLYTPRIHHRLLLSRAYGAVHSLSLTLNIPRGVLWGPHRVIFCDPALTISTNLLLIFVCVPHQLEIKYYVIRFIKCSFKKNVKN